MTNMQEIAYADWLILGLAGGLIIVLVWAASRLWKRATRTRPGHGQDMA